MGNEITSLSISYCADIREWTVELLFKKPMRDGHRSMFLFSQTPQQVDLARKAQRALERRYRTAQESNR